MTDVLDWLRSDLPTDPLAFWVLILMALGVCFMAFAGLLLQRSNSRLHEQNEHALRARQVEAEATEQAIDALSGRGAVLSPESNSELRDP